MTHTTGPHRLSLKGVSNRALFAYRNGRFASSFLLLGIAAVFITPFKPDRVSFCTPDREISEGWWTI